MKTYRIILSAAFAAMLWACSVDEQMAPQTDGLTGQTASDEGVVPGVMTLKVSEDLADRLLEYADGQGVLNEDGIALLQIPGVNVTEAESAFLIGGRFEKRQRAAGLHRWFKVRYDSNVPVSKASGDAASVPGIEFAEPVMKVEPMAVEMNDPYYVEGYQWHYNNTGQHGFTAGIDIRLQEAWDTYGVFGDPSVIVGVVDRGVQFAHPDLADNMWVNEAELNGEPGVDDDGNGFVDDVYGYNFVYDNATIHPQNHGTHVAGTIAAVNNNGVGLCGVAGGYYPDQKGVRVMSLQLLEEGETQGGDTQKAFQYAAENGACIVNNSWGYAAEATSISAADKAAIDYFVENAGLDENGNQVGPMKGGLVIFAAGNYQEEIGYPAQYEKALAVAAIGPTGKYAYYTNYGDWVDICAPGGDDAVNHDYGGVFSTITNGLYGSDRGTSMAAPHVAGVAALVLSTKTPEDGFTADNLFKLLVNTADPSIYEYNMNRSGMLGSGMLDAVAALGAALGTPDASPVTSFDMESDGNSIIFTLDEPENASYFYVYYDDSEFSADNLEDAKMKEFRVADLEYAADGRRTMTLSGLDFNTEYWCTVVSANVIGDESAAMEPKTISTKENRAPVITPDQEGDIVLTASGTIVRTYTIIEPDGQNFTREFSGTVDDAVELVSLTTRSVQLTINALYLEPGEYSCSITARDNTGEETGVATLEIPFTVLENNAPRFTGSKDIAIGGAGSTYTFNPYDCFYDKDGDRLTFNYNFTSPDIVSYTELENGLVEFTALKTGKVNVAITATDPRGEGVAGGISISVLDSGSATGDACLSVYPNPARDYVKVRTSESGIYEVTVTSVSGSTVYSASTAISPSQPYEIDLTDVAPGTYSLVLRQDGKVVGSCSFVRI